MTARFEGRRTELDELLRMKGVNVSESDWKESDCDASSVSLSMCSTEERVESPLCEAQATGDRPSIVRPYRAKYGASQFMPSCYYEVPQKEFSFHDHHFISGEGNNNAPVSRVPMSYGNSAPCPEGSSHELAEQHYVSQQSQAPEAQVVLGTIDKSPAEVSPAEQVSNGTAHATAAIQGSALEGVYVSSSGRLDESAPSG